jgi:hypothetical protein
MTKFTSELKLDDVGENVASRLFIGWLKSDDYTSLLLGENLLS